MEKNRVWRWMLKTERAIMVTSAVLVTLIMFFECILHVLQINFVGYEELVTIAAFWMYMMGSAYGSHENSHIKADVMSVMLKDGVRKDIAEIIEKMLTLALCLIFLYWAWSFVIWSFQAGARTPAWRIPNVVGQGSVGVGLALMAIHHTAHLFKACLGFQHKYFSGRDVQAN